MKDGKQIVELLAKHNVSKENVKFNGNEVLVTVCGDDIHTHVPLEEIMKDAGFTSLGQSGFKPSPFIEEEFECVHHFKPVMEEKEKIEALITLAEKKGWYFDNGELVFKATNGLLEYRDISYLRTAKKIVEDFTKWYETFDADEEFFNEVDELCANINEAVKLGKDCKEVKRKIKSLSKAFEKELEKLC